MILEYGPAKSAVNKAKHGIDFDEAQDLWSDPTLLVAVAKTVGEQRFPAIGKIGTKHWAAICTTRSTSFRIISVRRARSEEIDHYENS